MIAFKFAKDSPLYRYEQGRWLGALHPFDPSYAPQDEITIQRTTGDPFGKGIAHRFYNTIYQLLYVWFDQPFTPAIMPAVHTMGGAFSRPPYVDSVLIGEVETGAAGRASGKPGRAIGTAVYLDRAVRVAEDVPAEIATYAKYYGELIKELSVNFTDR